MNYEGTVMNRSVVFPSSLSAREIELNCAIRPGALAGSYSVTWERKSLFVVLSMTTFDIMVETNFSTPFEYCCRVKIEHMPGLEREYSGPQIMIVGRCKFQCMCVCVCVCVCVNTCENAHVCVCLSLSFYIQI